MYTVPDQPGRRIIVTGANSGTGKETATRLAGAGAKVVLAVRSIERGEMARDDILRRHPDATLEVRRIDLADLASVREFAAGILADGAPVDTLVNNAGVMAPPKRFTTTDGFELQFGSNFLGPFALTALLLPRILESPSPRVATMTSFMASFGSIRFGDLQYTKGYIPFRAYAQSKLADMLMGLRLASIANAQGWTLKSTLAHPGYTRTNLQTAGRNLGSTRERPPVTRTVIPSQSVEQGAEPLLFAAADPLAVNGGYYGPSRRLGLVGETTRAGLPRSSRGVDLAASLWSVAEELTGTRMPDGV